MRRKFSRETSFRLLVGLFITCAFAAGLLGRYGFATTAALVLCVGLGTMLGILIAPAAVRRPETAATGPHAGEHDEYSTRTSGDAPSAAGLESALRTATDTANAVAQRLSSSRSSPRSGFGAHASAARNAPAATERHASRAASPDVVWHEHRVTRSRRESLHGHRGAVLWLTGLPSSGKSTIANALDERLHRLECRSFVLDGDNVRHGLCGDLTFSEADREENIRRVTEVCRLFLDAGAIAIGAFVSPYRRDRDRARALFRRDDFLEIYCRCPLEVCEERDPKGLYKRARLGEVQKFTGISSPYEAPDHPELDLDTSSQSVQVCVDQIFDLLRQRGTFDQRTASRPTSERSSELAS